MTLDFFSREVSGWHIDDNMEANLVVEAARKAASLEGAGPGSVHHPDRGCQYTSNKMRAWLRERGVLCSMSAAGYCCDNATCESFFATLKREAFRDNCVFEAKAGARRTVFEYVETFYNRCRIHTSLGNRAPAEILTNHFQQETITLI